MRLKQIQAMFISYSHKKATKFILILFLISMFVFQAPSYAQNVKPTSRESLIQNIELRARRDVKLKREPASISDLEILFGKKSSALGLTMVEVLDNYESVYSTATPVKPWWAVLRPETGWITAGVVAVLAVLWSTLKSYLTRFFKWLAVGVYNQLAGYKPFWWIVLSRYRRALVREHQELKIPFRTGRPLQMSEIFVPLKVTGSSGRTFVDARSALTQNTRLMIVGEPGSGKTMLMRHIALTYGRG